MLAVPHQPSHPFPHLLPKPMVPVVNRPLIYYTLSLLERHAVREVAVNLHHLGDKIHSELSAGHNLGITITYSFENPILGTGGGVMRMRDFLSKGTFFLVNGDILTGVDLQQVLRFHRERKAAATMVVRKYPNAGGYTKLGIDEENWIVAFKDVHRSVRGKISPVMFCGVHVLEPIIFDFLPRKGFSSINSQGYSAMMKAGLNVAAFVDKSTWFDLGTPADYLVANRELLSGRVKVPQMPVLLSQDFSDGVVLGKGVVVESGVQLGPEVAVGDKCILEKNARIARSVIWPHTVVPAGADLNQVILAEKQLIKV